MTIWPIYNTLFGMIILLRLFLITSFCVFTSIIHAKPLSVGASYAEVVAALGEPDGDLNAGSRQILTYGKAQIKLKHGKVSSISPDLEKLLAERDANQDSIKAKRAAGLINHEGKWMRRSERDAIVVRENKEKAAQVTTVQAQAGWIANYDRALDIAKAQNKKILLNFTGSDWCGWCIKLDKEVFSQAKFLNYAKDNYVLVKLDFPKRSQLPAGLKQQNERLAKKFNVRGFPTVVVLNSNGKKYSTGGYVRGGPSAFIASIQ